MEIQPMMNLEEHQLRAVLGSHKFTAQDLSSENSVLSANSSPDHRGDDCRDRVQSCLLLDPDEDKTKLKKSFVSVNQNSIEFVDTVGFQRSEQVAIIPGEAPQDPSPLAFNQLHEAGNVSTSPSSAEDCCGSFPLPVPVAEYQSNQIALKCLGQTGYLKCECVKADFRISEPVSNGHVIRTPEDPGPILNLHSNPHLTVPSPDAQIVLDVPCIVKLKLSSITFSDYSYTSRADSHASDNVSSDDAESSPEQDGHDDDDDDGDDDVFKELPPSRNLIEIHRHRIAGKDKQRRRGTMSGLEEIDHTANSCYAAEGETSSNEESPQVTFPWSEPVSQLMKKLDQLNLDIKEVLSASSSRSDTPCTTPKKQWGAVATSASNQTPKSQLLQRKARVDCADQVGCSSPHSTSQGTEGTRAGTKKT